MDATKETAERKKFGWRVNEWSEAVGCSRASTYELISGKNGTRIESVKFGGARIIRTHPDDFLASLAEGH
jgi:hypothetical protein